MLNQRRICDVIISRTPETGVLIVNMKQSKWISLHYNCVSPSFSEQRQSPYEKCSLMMIDIILKQLIFHANLHLVFEHLFTVTPVKVSWFIFVHLAHLFCRGQVCTFGGDSVESTQIGAFPYCIVYQVLHFLFYGRHLPLLRQAACVFLFYYGQMIRVLS